MKKNMKKNIIIILCAWVLVYVCASFNLWELNPEKWAKEVRQVFTFSCLCLIVLIPMIIKMFELDE